MLKYIVAEKPSGWNTHQSHPGRAGFVEYLEQKFKTRFFPVSRLDQGTSGCLILPKDARAAAVLTELFATEQVHKTYWMLTDRLHPKSEIHVKSRIEKIKNSFVSVKTGEPNSETKFRFLKNVGRYFLWEATPLTGKPHQIRLHAKDLGIPVLGDKDHDGSEFYRLCLHCLKIEFICNREKHVHTAREPVWSNMGGGLDWFIQEAIQKRAELLTAAERAGCFRLIHQESPDFKLDIFGPQAWAYRYREDEMDQGEMLFWNSLQAALEKPLLVKNMENRGKDPLAGDVKVFGRFNDTWSASENGLIFEFRKNSGQSPGLFLDQRPNREWVRENAKGKDVLNLFCYTGGFSVAAAAGGAKKTVSVDVSKNFLDWTKTNFTLNNFSVENHEFWASDCPFFLKTSLKKNRRWDLIVCDPPSFGRSKEGIFRIDKDLPELLSLCENVLNPGGKILFSTNYEKWSQHDVHELLKNNLENLKIDFAPSPGWDFELSEKMLLKSFILSKP